LILPGTAEEKLAEDLSGTNIPEQERRNSQRISLVPVLL
jgi:hypothetical protein